MIDVQKIKHLCNLIFFYEFGQRMDDALIEQQDKAYVLLAMIARNKISHEREFFVDGSDLTLANKLWVNQIKADKSFHFDTAGKIFGLGFGPKYSIDDKTNLSVGQFTGGGNQLPMSLNQSRRR